MQRLLSRIADGATARRVNAAAMAVAPNAGWMLVGLALFLLVWMVVALRLQNAVLLPTPLAVWEGFLALGRGGVLIHDVLASLRRVFVGFLLASSIAVPLALLLAYFSTPRRIALPIITLLRPIPPIAWIPIAILWFGIGDPPSYFITAVAAFFPVFLNSFFGGLAVEEQHVNAAKCLGANRLALVRLILFPAALPMIWTGLKIGLGQSWMAVVTAELIAAQSGLGYLIQVSRLNLETSHVLVGMVTIGLLGALMTTLLGGLERYVLPWKQK